ncbi:MAG TPA: hypothetical protein VN957_08960 [Chthoniobacterales bacterium]|nr:hypothetical protein [Chthoniobacterales bacterium]
MTEAALSEVSDGAKWNPDPSFNVADAILADPAFTSLLKMVLRDGHVMVPPPKAKGWSPPSRRKSILGMWGSPQWLWLGAALLAMTIIASSRIWTPVS